MRRVTLVTLGWSLRAGKSPAFLVGPGACPVRAVADEKARVEDFEQEGGQGQVKLVGVNPR